jgi:hypothetical protein
MGFLKRLLGGTAEAQPQRPAEPSLLDEADPRRIVVRAAESVGLGEADIARAEEELSSAGGPPDPAEALDRVIEGVTADAAAENRWFDVYHLRAAQASARRALGHSYIEPARESWKAWHQVQARSGVTKVQIVGECCATCDQDDGRVFPVVSEIGRPRLPHAACEFGFCRCAYEPVDWASWALGGSG